MNDEPGYTYLNWGDCNFPLNMTFFHESYCITFVLIPYDKVALNEGRMYSVTSLSVLFGITYGILVNIFVLFSQ